MRVASAQRVLIAGMIFPAARKVKTKTDAATRTLTAFVYFRKQSARR
jgi:hypothetical protein